MTCARYHTLASRRRGRENMQTRLNASSFTSPFKRHTGPSMSGHSKACSGSRNLCDQLFEQLSIRIPRLNRSQTKQWCGLHQLSRSRFAYIAHKKDPTVWRFGAEATSESCAPVEMSDINNEAAEARNGKILFQAVSMYLVPRIWMRQCGA